ncbi:MAG: sulfatase-like hydrolase/transferase, partial [Oceanipulchritudo sp.]
MPDSVNPPNLILFLTDDHGHWTLPCYGNRIVRSPALSALAKRGMVYDRAFTPSPVCSPARASLLTGRIPSAHGIHDWIPEARDDGSFPHIDSMPGNLAERLHQAGYETAYVGKYHCNHAHANPLGFDYWFTQKPPVQYDCSRQQVWFDNGQERLQEGPQGTVVTEAALRFLKSRNTEKPFCLIIGHTNTHTPHTGEDAARVRYYQEKKDLGVDLEAFSEAHGRARFLPREEALDRHQQLAQYFAAVESI